MSTTLERQQGYFKMFDPTAFDNLKVVLEGEIYDADLAGIIEVIKRKDIVDLAAMSRTYQNTFSLKEGNRNAAAEFSLKMSTSQLSGELLKKESNPGCEVHLKFHVYSPYDQTHARSIVIENWGAHHSVTHHLSHTIPAETYKHTFVIDFRRLIGEDQMDDLIAMAEHAIDTLDEIEKKR